MRLLGWQSRRRAAIAGHAPPASVSLARWVVVFVMVSLFAWPQIRADWTKLEDKAGVLTFLALVGGTAFGTLQFVALQYTTALNMGVVGSVSPAFIVAASYILFRERLGPSQLFGVAVSLAGVLAIVSQLDPERLLSLTFNGGDLIILVNMAFWAIYCACLRLRPAVHPMSFLFVIAYVAALGNAPFAAWEYAVGLPARSRPADGVGRALCGALHQPARLHHLECGIDLIGAPRASAFLHTIPLFSALLATSLLGERLMLFHIVGFVLILAGVSLAARPTRERPAPAMLGEGPA